MFEYVIHDDTYFPSVQLKRPKRTVILSELQTNFKMDFLISRFWFGLVFKIERLDPRPLFRYITIGHSLFPTLMSYLGRYLKACIQLLH